MSRCKYRRGHRRVTQADYYAGAAGLVRDADEAVARGLVASYSLPNAKPAVERLIDDTVAKGAVLYTQPVGRVKFPRADDAVGRALGKSLHDKGFRLKDES